MGVLVCLAVMDIHSRQIPVFILVLGSLAALGYQVFVGKGDIWVISGGIAVRDLSWNMEVIRGSFGSISIPWGSSSYLPINKENVKKI